MSELETTESPRATYLDCLKGTAPVPRGGVEKKTFTLLMVGGMVTFMVNFNGVLHSGLGFYPHGVWLIPIVFCIAFLVKTQLVGKFTDMLIGKFVIPNLTGFKKGLGITLCNVCVMAPIMSSIVTLLLQGTDGYFAHLARAPHLGRCRVPHQHLHRRPHREDAVQQLLCRERPRPDDPSHRKARDGHRLHAQRLAPRRARAVRGVSGRGARAWR